MVFAARATRARGEGRRGRARLLEPGNPGSLGQRLGARAGLGYTLRGGGRVLTCSSGAPALRRPLRQGPRPSERENGHNPPPSSPRATAGATQPPPAEHRKPGPGLRRKRKSEHPGNHRSIPGGRARLRRVAEGSCPDSGRQLPAVVRCGDTRANGATKKAPAFPPIPPPPRHYAARRTYRGGIR